MDNSNLLQVHTDDSIKSESEISRILTSFDRRIGLRDVPSHGSEKRDPVLSGSDGVSRRRINHEATVLGRRRQIHVVDADAGASDDLEPPTGRLEHIAANLGAAANDQSVAERDLGAELFGAQVIRAVDVRNVFHELESGLSQRLGDEDRRLGVHGHHYEHRCRPPPAWERD